MLVLDPTKSLKPEEAVRGMVMGEMVVKVEGEIDLDLVAELLVDGFLEWLERREKENEG